jgi:hypothetical protein
MIADVAEAAAAPVIPPEDYFPEWPLRTVLAHVVTEAAEPALSGLTLLDEATASASRFIPCLRRQDADKTAALVDWLARAHASVGSPRLSALGEVSARAPNAAAQPDLGLPRRSLWSAEPSERSLAGARVVGLEERGLLALAIERELHALVPLSAVNLASDDRILQLLLTSSMRFPRPPAFEGAAAAQVELGGKEQGVHRFIAWCTTHREHGTGHVTVRRPDAPPLRVPMTSPLAVSALLEGATGPAVLEPVAEEPFIRDETGHYVAQLVLPFRRRGGTSVA